MYYSKKTSRLSLLLSFFIALTMFQACDVDDLVGLNYEAVENYGTFLGDPFHPTVIIHSQGGTPTVQLLDQKMIDLVSPINTNEIIMANIGQSQVLNSRALYNGEISASEAAAINAQSVDDLATVIRHFKGQDKKVYVVGTGFGGHLTQSLIARYGTDIADKFMVMGSRLSFEPEFTQAWSAGKNAIYDYNATPSSVVATDAAELVDANLNRLFGAIGQENFMESLSAMDLSKLTFVTADQDEVVGTLSPAELTFLQTKGVTMVTGSGDHETGKQNAIVDGMREGFGIE